MNAGPIADATRDGTLVVSVVIPTYNAAATIAEQLAALERQTVPGEWEIVISLQPCTDDTEAVIARSAGPRVRIVHSFERRGPSYARNVGAAAARAPLIAFCDADDIVADDWLAELLARAEAPVVTGGVIPFEDPTELDAPDRPPAKVAISDWDFLQSLYTGNLLVSRNAFEAVGGFDVDLQYCEDTDLAWRLQLAGYEIVTAPNAVVYYRQRTTTRGRWLQFHRWCRTAPTLYRRYRHAGMPRTDLRRSASDWVWLVVRIPFLALPARRRAWLRRLARRSGFLVGSVKARCIYL